MSPLPARAVAVLAAVAALGCIDSLAPEDIDGSWIATTMVFSSVEDPSTTYDFLADDGGFQLELAPTGLATLTFTVGSASNSIPGTWSVVGKTFTLTVGGEPASAVAELDGDGLTLDFQAGMSHDFDGDGTDEAATLLMVLTRP